MRSVSESHLLAMAYANAITQVVGQFDKNVRSRDLKVGRVKGHPITKQSNKSYVG